MVAPTGRVVGWNGTIELDCNIREYLKPNEIDWLILVDFQMKRRSSWNARFEQGDISLHQLVYVHICTQVDGIGREDQYLVSELR